MTLLDCVLTFSDIKQLGNGIVLSVPLLDQVYRLPPLPPTFPEFDELMNAWLEISGVLTGLAGRKLGALL